jgi:hypothetical protein
MGLLTRCQLVQLFGKETWQYSLTGLKVPKTKMAQQFHPTVIQKEMHKL